VLYKGTHRLVVVGRIKRLSTEFGVMLDDIVAVRDDDGEVTPDKGKSFTAAKTLFENRWIVEYVAMKPVADEVVLGMKM
jgi:nitrogen fixation protein FixH